MSGFKQFTFRRAVLNCPFEMRHRAFPAPREYQNARHDQNENLTNLLGNLEEKFKARTVELDYCNSQIESLTQDNAQLSELVERLVNLIESGPENAEDDPLIRASTMAATLLKDWSDGEAG